MRGGECWTQAAHFRITYEDGGLPTRDPRQWHFARRLRVVAVGAWGTVPQSTVDDLIALGFNLDQTVETLGKVGDILSTANYGIYRQRHANTAAAPRAAVPRRPPATP